MSLSPDRSHEIARSDRRDATIGITGDGFVLVAASSKLFRSITVLRSDRNRTKALNSHNLMAISGSEGDCDAFGELIQANVQLYTMRNATDLGPHATASYVRGEIARGLRSRDSSAGYVNLLLAGYDTVHSRPKLYWMDYLGTMADVPYAAHGYTNYYVLSILDKYHRRDISLERAVEIMGLCTDEVRRRLPYDFGEFIVKVVDKDGIRDVPTDFGKRTVAIA